MCRSSTPQIRDDLHGIRTCKLTLCVVLNVTPSAQTASEAGGLQGFVISHQFLHALSKPRCLWLGLFQQIACKFQRALFTLVSHRPSERLMELQTSTQRNYDTEKITPRMNSDLSHTSSSGSIHSSGMQFVNSGVLNINRLYQIPLHRLYSSFPSFFTCDRCWPFVWWQMLFDVMLFSCFPSLSSCSHLGGCLCSTLQLYDDWQLSFSLVVHLKFCAF